MRRPTTGLGTPGAPKAARYYGTTAQKSVGPNRPIVLRVSADGRALTRALFGESVKCSDGKLSIGVEAPRTNSAIDSRGRVRDREQFTITEGETVTHVDDRFTAELGSRGARGTFSLSDRTTDRASGRTIQTLQVGHDPLARLALLSASAPSRALERAPGAALRVSRRSASATQSRTRAAADGAPRTRPASPRRRRVLRRARRQSLLLLLEGADAMTRCYVAGPSSSSARASAVGGLNTDRPVAISSATTL